MSNYTKILQVTGTYDLINNMQNELDKIDGNTDENKPFELTMTLKPEINQELNQTYVPGTVVDLAKQEIPNHLLKIGDKLIPKSKCVMLLGRAKEDHNVELASDLTVYKRDENGCLRRLTPKSNKKRRRVR